ncbi:histone methyltransferase set2 [Orbilia oligospora]|uniref:Histone-lysine N-methyltransferase, H3 lysine-36 specific n=1 Tax=Orbilia oligospora TaxID=2813651 RepID=A0A6G1MKI5_ORBOL|nr:histone methyltransferase set2 [Orbilia oligospora]KAF3212296.1 histone methyltransferase set2 [Orbilia oligospora]KAF3224600.1 histone methyltransferase set2 [Orbilia oligospora]KAF3261050.1 histone methyltransferase set2 [Orbilia oligospora]
MTSTEVVLPSGSASIPITTSQPHTILKKGESPPPPSSSTLTPTPTQTEDNGESTSNGFKMEESSSPLSNPSPQEVPPSTNPSSPRDAKPDVPDNSEGLKMERSESSSTPQPPARGGRKPKKARHIVLYNDLPDKTEEAQAKFQLMEYCTYQPKSLADSGQEEELMSCDCRPEYDDGVNHACSQNCINAETFVECVDGDSNCGGQCQNQRFQKREYANVSVIQTEMKGYGLRANTPMEPGTFIYEYVGEVIGESQFRKRRELYGKEDIKHFYFMSIKVGEYIDATKRGCLARFCNHSCNPNCMVEKWVVGGKLRMGIFAKVKIEAGEELTFDYNVDRYGADPQKCFCGEPNCIGYIGGKTQTEASTKLPTLYLEALGLDDDDAWLTATSRKAQKKKRNDDGDYIYKAKIKELSHDGVPKVMGTLMQASKQWIVVKLLDRIEAAQDPKVLPRVLEMHGYKIFNKLLGDWRTVTEIVLPILQIMHKWPRITKNKISSSKIEGTVKELAESSSHPKVKELAAELAESWGALEMGYRIPRRQKDSNDSPNPEFERRNRRRSRSRSRSPPEQEKPVNIPTGPRNSKPQFIPKPRSFPKDAPKGPRIPNVPLPPEWKVYKNPNGKTYYHNTITNATQWDHPGKNTPPTPSARAPIVQKKDPRVTGIIQSIEDEVVRETEERRLMRIAAAQQQQQQPPTPEEPVESEEERAKKLLHHERRVKFAYYTIVKETTAIFLPKMGKVEIKKRNEEITRLCARKDMKKTGLKTPIEISSEKHRQIRKFTQDYMRSLWKKMKAHYIAKKAKEAAAKGSKPEGGADKDATELDADKEISSEYPGFDPDAEFDAEAAVDVDETPAAKDDEEASIEPSPNTGPLSPKRKRSDSEDDEIIANGAGSPKRGRFNETIVLSSAQPPPPPPGSPPPVTPLPASPTGSTPVSESRSPKHKRDEDEEPVSIAEEELPRKRARSIPKSRSPSPRPVSNPAVQTTA